ncbi:unnamed protein product [Sphagnum jensenii]
MIRLSHGFLYEEQDEQLQTERRSSGMEELLLSADARSLEERLEDTARGRAFLLQGGDCAERFKEFNANNIRDTFHILLRIPLSSCLEANRQF